MNASLYLHHGSSNIILLHYMLLCSVENMNINRLGPCTPTDFFPVCFHLQASIHCGVVQSIIARLALLVRDWEFDFCSEYAPTSLLFTQV